MKKIVALLLAVMLLMGTSVVCAEGIDLSGKTAQELLDLIDAARIELALQMPPVSDGVTLYEDDNLVITLNGDPFIEYGSLVLPTVVVNKTERNLIISFDNASCNGWDVLVSTASVSASKKAKEQIEIYSVEEDADLTDVADLQDVSCRISYFDDDDWDWYYEIEETLVWTFAQ